MNEQPEREYKAKLPDDIKPAFGHQYDTMRQVPHYGTVNGVPLSWAAEYAHAIDLINHVSGGGKLEAWICGAWVDAGPARLMENLEHINDPKKFRKAEVKLKSVSTPLRAKHILSCMQFRHENWVEHNWCLPTSVDTHGVWMHLGDGQLRIVPWNQLASEWLWNAPGELDWRRCDLENSPVLSQL